MSKWNDRTPASRALALLGLLGPALAAQSLSLPASDPVGLARSGAGVAFGRSLEAASLNPALLTTLEGKGAVFLALGEEFQSAQVSLQSNQKTDYSTDRNRFLPSLGLGLRLGDRTAFGLKVDVPFLRHGRLPDHTTARFLGDELDLKTLRAEVQLARAFGSQGQFSLGLSGGIMKVDFANGAAVRALVGADPTAAVSGANPSLGLVETRVSQSASATVGTFGFGLRWALNPRWTLGLSGQAFAKATPSLTPAWEGTGSALVANDGFSTPPLGFGAKAAATLGASAPAAGSGTLALPGRATLGLRQRVNNLFTWEADLRYVRMSDLQLPTMPALRTPSGTVSNGAPAGTFRDTLGLLVAGEFTLDKRWTIRGGFSLEQGGREDQNVEPLLGGARTASFSVGAGLRALGGEWNLGYQVRLSQDQDNARLDGTWNSAGYRPTGTVTRVEGMGHAFSLGYRKQF